MSVGILRNYLHSLAHSLTHSLAHSLTRSLTYPPAHPLTCSLVHSIIGSLARSLTHPPMYICMCAYGCARICIHVGIYVDMLLYMFNRRNSLKTVVVQQLLAQNLYSIVTEFNHSLIIKTSAAWSPSLPERSFLGTHQCIRLIGDDDDDWCFTATFVHMVG